MNTAKVGLGLIQSLEHERITDTLLKALSLVGRLGDDPEASALAKQLGPALTAMQDIFEMTEEISESTDIAVDLLDSTIYEKIEGGILALECHLHPILQRVMGTVRPLLIQLKALGLDLHFTCETTFAANELERPTFLSIPTNQN